MDAWLNVLKRANIVGLLMAVITMPSSANPLPHDPAYLGPGGMTCADYLQVKRDKPEASAGIDLWLLGHVSGMNLRHYADQKADLLRNEDQRDALSFVLGYCAANKQVALRRVALEYWIGLVQRSGRQTK